MATLEDRSRFGRRAGPGLGVLDDALSERGRSQQQEQDHRRDLRDDPLRRSGRIAVRPDVDQSATLRYVQVQVDRRVSLPLERPGDVHAQVNLDDVIHRHIDLDARDILNGVTIDLDGGPTL